MGAYSASLPALWPAWRGVREIERGSGPCRASQGRQSSQAGHLEGVRDSPKSAVKKLSSPSTGAAGRAPSEETRAGGADFLRSGCRKGRRGPHGSLPCRRDRARGPGTDPPGPAIDWDDSEGAVQASCAAIAEADYLLTGSRLGLTPCCASGLESVVCADRQ